MSGQIFSGEIAFSQPVINIGADPGNDIVVIGPSVADFHAMMHYDSNRWYITPLDPSKKTLVNGRVVDEYGTTLSSGAVVTIGNYRMTMMLNGINSDIIMQGDGQSAEGSFEYNQTNPEANILLAINGTPPSETPAGGSVEFGLTVTNAGPLVANMQLQVQGIPSSWVQVIPPVVNLNEGRKGTFSVYVNPPHDSSAEAGLYNLHFVVSSPNYPRETATADTGLTVLPYSEFMLNGPVPRQLKLSRSASTDVAEVVIINNSNAVSNFIVQSYDDASELQFSFERGNSGLFQNQEMVSVRAGDNTRVPISITPKNIPLIGFSSHTRHYSVNVTPSDRPGDSQSVIGEVVVRPLIRVYVLLLLLLLLALLGLFVFQPYIRQFDGADGKRTQVVLSGNSAQIIWRVSSFASKVTLDDGSGAKDVNRNDTLYVSPSSSTTYTLRSENFLSRLLGIEHVKTIQVLSIPNRPTISMLRTDISNALFQQPVTLSWAVELNADTAKLTVNKQEKQLTAENYSGSEQDAFDSDALISLKAENASGYEMKSLFVKVAPDVIDLKRFSIWVRPNGIAVPNDNDVRRTTRWSALQLNTNPADMLRPAGVNPQPAAQSNTLDIPDNFGNSGLSQPNMDPEQIRLNGQSIAPTPYVYTPPQSNSSGTELLVSPNMPSSQTGTTGAPQTVINPLNPVEQAAAPVTSPEGSGNGYNRDFSIKLMEIVEDYTSDSGYRVIEYFPDYQLQPNEQIMVEWAVDGVTKVTIDNLSAKELNPTGSDYATPEKAVTFVLHAEVGQVKKDYSLPLRVAGAADDGEGSGLNCELKANATTLKVPGTVMLTWKGGGSGRVQIVSSAKAESDSADAEKKKEEDAKAKGEDYSAPTQPAPMTGGIIADYLQPSGFMRVGVDKQTTFMLNAYDGNGNVICTKSVEVKYEGGNDKEDIPSSSFKITRIADVNDVVQDVYAIGQTINYTVAFTGFPKDKEPSGNVSVSDGVSTCTMTLPVTTCSLQAKKAGELTITAVYSGDDNYKKATTTSKETVINKLPSSIEIHNALKLSPDRANVEAELTWTVENSYNKIPSGIVTLTMGGGTCDIDITNLTSTCGGTVEVITMEKMGSISITANDQELTDTAAATVKADYKGNDYFNPSSSKAVQFNRVVTETTIYNVNKTDDEHLSFEVEITWIDSPKDGVSPTGTLTITAGSGTCVIDVASGTSKDCGGRIIKYGNRYVIENMTLSDTTAKFVKAAYSGDSAFQGSESQEEYIGKIDTEIEIVRAYKTSAVLADVAADLSWDLVEADGKTPTGTITFIASDSILDKLTCVYVIGSDPKDYSCSGDISIEGYQYSVTAMPISDSSIDRVRVLYSGDDNFKASTSTRKLFEKIETTTEIKEATKSVDGKADLKANIKWNGKFKTEDSPTGTVTFTSGTGTCTLEIPAGADPKFTDCKADKVEVAAVEMVGDEYVLEIKVSGLIIEGIGDRIKAEYSGDSLFLPSSSLEVKFDNIDTISNITTAFKYDDKHVTVRSELTWDPEKNENNHIPGGTITYTIGTGTCVLDFTNQDELKFSCENESFNVDMDNVSDGKIIFTIDRMLVADNTADRITTAYSGDTHFNPSTSSAFVFMKVDTATRILEAYKPVASIADIITSLTRNEDKWKAVGCDDDGIICPEMTGTLTYTISSTPGTQTCVLDIVKQTMDCSGTVNVPESQYRDGDYSILNVLLSYQDADRVKIVYSGDAFYNASTAAETLLNRVLTETVISEADKRTEGDERFADFTVEVSWLDQAKDAATPTGTLTFTFGNATCDIDMVTGEGVGEHACEVTRISKYGSRLVVEGLALGDEDPDSITADYSGDSAFHPSTSQPWIFGMIDTEIVIERAFKPDDTMANLVALLTWDEEEAGDKKPTGKVTFIASNSMVDTVTCVYDMDADPKEFNCQGTITDNNYEFTIENMPIGQISADRIRVLYSGDGTFNPSTSKMVKFKIVGTAIEIKDAAKTADNVVSMTTELTWDEFVSGGVRPSGSIKFTSGTRTCTLDISGDPFKFTDCDGSIEEPPYYNESERILRIKINSLPMTGAGETIKAEYSGSGAYLASTSPEVSFGKINTELKIIKNSTHKTDSSHVNVAADLIWKIEDAGESNPVGTVTFTIGKTVCTLDFIANTLSGCEAEEFSVSGPEVAPDDESLKEYHLKIENILLEEDADRVKADYSGDSMFNPSSDSALFVKIDTTLDISKNPHPYKHDEMYANVTSILSWDQDENWKILGCDKGFNVCPAPTGTIKFTTRNGADSSAAGDAVTGTCVLDLVKKTMNCEGQPDVMSNVPAQKATIVLTDMLLADKNADRIKAEYSGDSFYNASESTIVLFNVDSKIDTTLTINSGSKVNNVIALELVLAPDEVETGTITFTSGSATCTLNITDRDEMTFEKCSGTAEYTDGKFRITGMIMNGTPGDSIYAEYSGDSQYNKSASAAYIFPVPVKKDTTLNLSKGSKSTTDLITITAKLDGVDPSTPATGALTFTSGAATCTVNIESGAFEKCSGTFTKNDDGTYTVTNMAMNGTPGDTIYAEYSGDTNYNKSTSPAYEFNKIDTTLTIQSGSKATDNSIGLLVKLDKGDGTDDPTGTFTFTSGSATCAVNIESGVFEKCSGTLTPNGDGTYTVSNMMMNGTPGDAIFAEYSGDNLYNKSTSPSYTFGSGTKETTLTLSDGSKGSDNSINITALLGGIDPEEPASGTITFTSGQATCTLDIKALSFEKCSGKVEVDPDSGAYIITEMKMNGTTGSSIYAEYSGDLIYNKSTSNTIEFEVVETKLAITTAQKSLKSGNITMVMNLTWDDDAPGGKNPEGKITLTSGTKTCTLDLNADPVGFTDCEGDVTVNVADKKLTFEIANLDMEKKAGTTISAKYSGDGTFLASTADDFTFEKLDTTLDIEKAYKFGTTYLNLSDLILTWDNELSEGVAPTGTITLTIGSDSCVMTFDNETDGNVKSFTCVARGETEIIPDSGVVFHDKTIRWTMEKILLSAGSTADRVKADYSGDTYFKESSSTMVLFMTSETVTAITDAEKSSTGLVSMNIAVIGSIDHPDGLKPLGTIKITSGSKTCTLETTDDPANAKFTDCLGTVTYDANEDIYRISDLEMGADAGNSINAVYSGDNAFFLGSTSPTVDFLKIDTWIFILDAYKSAPDRATIDMYLFWDETLSGSNKPTGSITFAIGSDSCKYDLTTREFSCEGWDTWVTPVESMSGMIEIKFENIVLTSDTADRVKASYSGDAIFNPSESYVTIFETVPTTLTISSDAYRPTDGYASFDSHLSWNAVAAGDRTPTGTIKYTVGSGTCTLDLSDKTLSCESTQSDYDPATGAIVIRNMLLDDKTADRIKAEYSGDGFFLPSTSTTILFKTVDTTTNIYNMTKTTAGVVNMMVTVHPAEEHPDKRAPQGTIKITSGSKTCTLDITSDPLKFTDCNYESIVKNGENFIITGLLMGSDAGNSIRAEYSGDSYFNGSTSPTVDFVKLDTTLTIEKAYKSAPDAAELVVKLGWTKDEAAGETPSGTIKLTIGSDTCTLNIQTKAFDCASPDTVIDDPVTTDVSYEWSLHNVLLSVTTADRVKAEYSGDATFNASTSNIVLFKTVPTTIAMLTAEKPDANHASVTADLTWDNTLNTENRTPAGTVKFNVGSGSCTLTLGTNTLSCEQSGVTVDSSTAGKLHMEILAMLLDDKSADRVYAEYSGDGYFEPSTSTKILMQKRDVDLQITRITDEAGLQHSFYTPGQTVRIVTNIEGALDDPAPTGTISVNVDTATCTITLPQNSCLLTLPKITGEDIPVNAVYSGDNGYNGDDAQSSITIAEPKQLTLVIDRITDLEGIEQDEYAMEQEVTVWVEALDVDENELPTGDITVKIDSSSAVCAINYPDAVSCKVKLPNAAGTYEVTAEYGGNTYYKSAAAEPKNVIIDKYGINFRIDTILNQETNTETGNTENHPQPYYVFDQEENKGQLMQVCVAFDNPAHGDPTGTITIYDADHDDGKANPYVTLTAGTNCGTFNVRNHPGEITLTAEYSGDSVYVSKKAKKSMTVRNRIDPHLSLDNGMVDRVEDNFGIIVFGFANIPGDLPEGVSYKKDTTRVPETEQTVTFTLTNGTDTEEIIYNLATGVVVTGNADVMCEENECFLISEHFPTPYVEGVTTVSAVYGSDNRYFFDADAGMMPIEKFEGGETTIELGDVLQVKNRVDGNKEHLFFTAELTYDKDTYNWYQVKPEGSLEITIVKTDGSEVEQTCGFNLSGIDPFNCGTITTEGNKINFEIRFVNAPEDSDRIKVLYLPVDGNHPYAESDEEVAYINHEDIPEITISEDGAQKTSNTTADLEFSVKVLDLTDQYDVYDLIQLGSKSDGTDEKTCSFRINSDDTIDWVGDTCTGTITRVGSVDEYGDHYFTYTIGDFSGIIAKEDTQLSVTVMNGYWNVAEERNPWALAEYPTAQADYWHKKIETSLTVSDVLKYMETNANPRAFLTYELKFDAEEAEKFGEFPGGSIRISSVFEDGSPGTRCYLPLDSSTEIPVGDKCEGAIINPTWAGDLTLILNVKINREETKLALAYSGDDYFEPSDTPDYASYTPETPVIEIQNAAHTAGTSGQEVYSAFTISGMGTLSEKYRANREIRFTSRPGGKTCVYNRINEAFDSGCTGTLTFSGDTYTLTGLTNLFTENDTELSIAVGNEEYLALTEYAHGEKAYGKLETSFVLSNELKVMNKYGFLTADFIYENEISGRYNVKPTGIFSFTTSAGTCSFNMKTGETIGGCYVWYDELAEMDGKIHFIVRKLTSSASVTAITAGYSGDDFFAEVYNLRNIDIDAHPVISITVGSAVKTTLTKANVTFQVIAAGYYADIYESFFDQIKLYSNSGRASYINISDIMEVSETSGTASFVNPADSGTIIWTKEGDAVTFTVVDWSGPINIEDTICYAELMSHTYLDESEDPKDDEPFGHTSSWTKISLSDAYAAEGNHVYFTAVLEYDPAIAESYKEIPTGTLTIKGSSGTADKVCAFDLSASPATFTLASDSSVSCGTVEHDAANHKATFIVRNYEGPAGVRVSRVWMRYDGDDYYDQSELVMAKSNMESPTVEISYLLRSLESDSSRNGYVMFTVDGIDESTLAGKYNVYPYIRLMRHTTGSAADYCLFDRAANTFTGYNNCHADEIIVNGNTYIFKNLNGEYNGQKIIQPRHNSFEVSLYPNIVTDRWSVTSYPMDYQLWLDRLNTSLSLPEIVKVSDRHVVVKAELTSDWEGQEVANAFGVSSTGTIHFTSGGLNCICDIDAGTCTGGCEAEVTKTVGTWPITMLVRNPTGTDVGTQIDAAYNSDRLFRYSDMTGTFVNGAPTITIDSAQKLSNTKANVTVTVHGNDYVEYYSSVYDQIRLAAHDGEYNYIENISDILRSSSTSGTATLSIGSGEVSWTKSGNDVTFTVTNWEGPIDAEDTQCTAWLLADGLREDQYPKAGPRNFTHAKGQVTLSFDGKVLNEFNDNYFMDVVLDYDPQTAAGFQKPKGRLTLRGYAVSTTCDFDLNQSTVSCQQSGCSAQVLSVDETAHKAIIRIRKFHSWGSNYMRVSGDNDDFYTYNSKNGNVVRVTPEVTVINAFKGPHQVGYAQIMIKSTEDLEKFELYPRVMLYSGKNDDDAHRAMFELRSSNPQFESPVTGTITGSYDPDTYTYTFMIRDMKNMIGADDTYLKAAANDTEIGSTVKSDAIDYETIYTTVTISDALVLVDAAGYEHAFGKINFSFSESGSAAKTFDFWPDGWMRVRAWANRGKHGYVNVSDPSKTVDAEDCGAFSFTSAKDASAHTYQISMKNMSVLNNTSSIQVIYNQDPYGDDLADFDGQFYKDTIFQAYETNLVSATRVKPTIDITEAKKYPVSSGSSYVPMVDVTFTVNGLSDLEPWDIFGAIRLSNDIYGITESYIDLSTNQLTDGSGQVSRSGDTFTITGWKKLSASDKNVVVSLVPKFSDISIPNRVAELSKPETTVSLKDVYGMDSAYFMTMVLNYDESGPAPTGTFEIEILDSSASCTVNLRTNQSTCSDDIEVRRIDGRVEVLVSGWMPTGAGTFTNYRLLYNGDDYYANSASPLYDSVQSISKPTVQVLSANRNGTVTFKINGYDSVYSKYLIIERVGLYSSFSFFIKSNRKNINILDLPVTESDTTITRSGDVFTVTNFPGADYFYTNCEVYINSLGDKYWREDSIYHDIRYSDSLSSTSPLSSGSPVTLTVGGFEPVDGD